MALQLEHNIYLDKHTGLNKIRSTIALHLPLLRALNISMVTASMLSAVLFLCAVVSVAMLAKRLISKAITIGISFPC